MIYKIFRFDKNTDYEAYYKPYVYEQSFDSFAKLLAKVKEDDIYFEYDLNPQSFIVVNGVFVKQSSSPCFFKKASEIIISPLHTARSTKDLVIDKEDFYSFIKEFDQLVEKNDIEYYKQLDYLFYQSQMREFAPHYKGDSYLVFMYKMSLKYPKVGLRFLKMIGKQIYYHTSFKHTLMHNLSDHEELIKELKHALFAANLVPELKHV